MKYNLIITGILFFIWGCNLEPAMDISIEANSIESKTKIPDSVRLEIINTVEKILVAAGNYNADDLRELCYNNAPIASISQKEGEWRTNYRSIQDYLDICGSDELLPFVELVSEYDIITTGDHMALVKADAVVNRFGMPGKREVNNMLLVKDSGQWKMLSIAWPVYELPKGEKGFNMEIFAIGYARAWCSQRPDFVAQYFAEDGVLKVNDGEPAVGRKAIADVAQSFMTTFPDMMVYLDSLSYEEEGVKFHWTLTGTDAGPEGKGNKVKISGYELWQMNDDNRIENSLGYFSAEEYERQLNTQKSDN